MCAPGRCFVTLIVLWWTAALCNSEQKEEPSPFPREFDFRYTSYEDLLAEAPVFEDPSLVGYTQITLDEKNDQLLVGSRDALFRLALDDLQVLEEADVSAEQTSVEICTYKGQPESKCHNFIRVLLLHNYTQNNIQSDVENAVFVCGTNAFKPSCSWRPANNLSYVIESHVGVGKAPYDPYHNSTALLTANGDFYGATVVGSDGRDPAIYRSMGPKTVELRTVQYNSKWLNEPDFISAYEIGDFVYFFFREVAVEYINCGKRVYSRVARVCKTDTGMGSRQFFDNIWTTYFKARLNCSRPGEFPFYYDELQHTYYLDDGQDKFIYAVFTTSMNSIAGSAVCVYNLTALNDSFTGPYKYQENPRSAWERHDNERPLTQCPEKKDQSKRSNDELVKQSMIETKYQLMDNAVQPNTFVPLLTADEERWTHVVVDNVEGKLGTYRVVFVATATGKLRKMTQLLTTNETCLIEEIKIVPNGEYKPVKAIRISPDKMAIFISTKNTIIKVPVHRCSRFGSNRDLCINANDPYCGWDESTKMCTSAPSGQPEVHFWYQSMANCPFVQHAVNGNWSDWSMWESCSQVGGDETTGKCKCRSRSCDNPKPYYGGEVCDGASVEVANCTANGQWTEWTSWSSCYQSCGSEAQRRRQRYCSNPPPRFGGLPCLGDDFEEGYCPGNPRCPSPPVESVWTEWTYWSKCSAECNGGIQTRRRNCNKPPATTKSTPCVGNTQEWRMCNTQICQELDQNTPWTPWVQVNATQGGHFEERFRFVCRAKVPSQSMIKAKHIKSQTRYCFADRSTCHDSDFRVVDVDGGWSGWGTWSTCTRACGGGLKRRTRECNDPLPIGNGRQCQGHAQEGQQCNTHLCQGQWTCWSDMSTCSTTCGVGLRARTRRCDSLPPGQPFSISCDGDSQEYIPCDKGPCVTVLLAQSSDTSSNDGMMGKTRFSLAQLLLVGGLSFIFGGSTSLAMFAYVRSFRRAMKEAKNKERTEKLEKSLAQQRSMQRKVSRVSMMKPMPSLSSQISLENILSAKNRVYDVESIMRDSMYDKDDMCSTLDRKCMLKTFTIKDL